MFDIFINTVYEINSFINLRVLYVFRIISMINISILYQWPRTYILQSVLYHGHTNTCTCILSCIIWILLWTFPFYISYNVEYSYAYYCFCLTDVNEQLSIIKTCTKNSSCQLQIKEHAFSIPCDKTGSDWICTTCCSEDGCNLNNGRAVSPNAHLLLTLPLLYLGMPFWRCETYYIILFTIHVHMQHVNQINVCVEPGIKSFKGS